MADYTAGEAKMAAEDAPLRTRERLDQIEKAQAITDDKINMLTERLGPILPPALAMGAPMNADNISNPESLSEVDERLERIMAKSTQQGSTLLALMNRVNL